MKSKLTLHIRSDVKARAKAIAVERGTSVSRLVETYFQMLGEKASQTPGSGSQEAVASSDASVAASIQGGDMANDISKLSPRIHALQVALGAPAPTVTPDKDTTLWGEHAAQKHA